MDSPRQPHMDVAICVLRYMKSAPTQGLFYQVGFCIFMGDSLISWKSNKQVTVSKFSAKAEFRSMAATTYELI
jgi:hypothetical protein